MTKIDIFSGFLGAGKTTLIKKLITEAFAGQQVVLIENEFGEIGIDGGFLKESGIQINELNAGCICCSLVGDFRTALQQVVEQYHPDRIVIEPSGVGKLSDVTRAVYQVLENNPALTVKDAADPLLAMKGVKNEVELAHLREAHLRDAVAMVRFQIELENRLASGEQLTELTVDEILHKYRSADDKFLVESFGTIAAYGGNAAMMHYHATPEDHAVLQRKGFLLVDSGATYLDGTTDITRKKP